MSICVSMEFEGEERKKGRRGRKGRGTYCHCWEFKDYVYLQRHLAPGSLIFSI